MRAAATQKHWNVRRVANCVRHAAVNHVADELVTVRRHRDQVALLARCGLRDLMCGISARENGICFDASLLELVSEALDVLAILLHLFALAKLELPLVPRCPPVCHVYQRD